MLRTHRAKTQVIPIGLMHLFAYCATGCLDPEVVTSEPKSNVDQLYGYVGGSPEWDVLLVIDDSLSMADKQKILAQSLSPNVFSLSGGRAFSRVGIISSSLEAGGASECEGSNRRAHLIPPPETDVPYMADLNRKDDFRPPDFERWLAAVGDGGCGFEAPLEAMYRFLIDPEPPKSVIREMRSDGTIATTAVGVDEAVLLQRKRFLRPRSSLMIVILTDEDDCSILDSGDGYQVASEQPLGPATSACATDASDPCCRRCSDEEAIEGCAPVETDPACTSSEAPNEVLNVRCLNQKQRFGVDLLQPVERYIDGLTKREVRDRDGNWVTNPLFAEGRDPRQVRLLTLTGAPWQFVARSEEPSEELEVLTPFDDRAKMWKRLLGINAGEEGADVRATESLNPRAGLPGPDAPPFADEIISHEFANPSQDKLQHSCLFALPSPQPCTDENTCECTWVGSAEQYPGNPVCEDERGNPTTTQYLGRAYPSPRIWHLAHALGRQSVVASVCPKALPSQTGEADTLDGDEGYLAALSALWIDQGGASCERPLQLTSEGLPENCAVAEVVGDDYACEGQGRHVADPVVREAVLKTIQRDGDIRDRLGRTVVSEDIVSSNVRVCELEPFRGDSKEEGTPAYACANDLVPELEDIGWCWVSGARGNSELLSFCPLGEKNRVRLLPDSGLLRPTPWGTTYTRLVCW